MATRKTPEPAADESNVESELTAVAEGWEPRGAHAKLAYIQTHIRNVEKTGVNTHHQYNYFQEHGLMDLLRPLLRELRCAVIESPGESFTREGNKITVQGTLRFVDTEAPPYLVNGDALMLNHDGQPIANPDREICATFVNEGVDNQDKATNKSLTGWSKYALQKFFLVPTERVDDADHSDVVQAQAAVASAPVPADPATTPVPEDVAATIAGALKAAVEAGQLDGNKVKAKLSTYRKKAVKDLTVAQAEEFYDWANEEIAKATPAPAGA